MSTYSTPGPASDPGFVPERAEALRSRIAHYRRILLGFWWVLALTASLGLAVQGWRSLTKPITYQSAARILVSGKITVPDGGLFNEEAVNFFGTQQQLMQSTEVRRRAAARVQSLRPDLIPTPVSLQVSQLPETSIFVLIARGSDPNYVKAYLDATLDEYIALRRGIFTEKTQTTLTAVTDELLRVERNLRADEDALFEWRRRNNLPFLQEEQQYAATFLSALNRELAAAEAEAALISDLSNHQNLDRFAAAKELDFSESTVETPDADTLVTRRGGSPADSYFAVKRQIFLLQAARQQLVETHRPTHPRVQKLDQEINQNQKLLEIYRTQAIEQLEAQRDALADRATNLRTQIAEWEVRALSLSEKVGEFDRLQSKTERQRALYDRLLATVQNVDVNANIQQDILSVLEYPTAPSVVSESLAQNLILGAGAGLFAGILILLMVGALDDRVVSMAHLQAIIGDDVAAIIPKVGQDHSLIRLTDDDNPGLFESFRKLRSWLLFTRWENGPPRSILFASAMPGEGKSTAAYNLATCLAASGSPTLLVDADLRRGNLHRNFGIEQDPGLGDVLNAKCTLDKAIHRTEIPNLWFTPRGYYGTKGSEIFLSTTLDHFLKEVETRFTTVIFDTSPALAVDETGILAGKVDLSFLVIRYGTTSLRIAKRARAHLLSRNAQIGGIIYNAVDSTSDEYPYYNYYYSTDGTKSDVATK